MNLSPTIRLIGNISNMAERGEQNKKYYTMSVVSAVGDFYGMVINHAAFEKFSKGDKVGVGRIQG
jgi:hypothetical protein